MIWLKRLQLGRSGFAGFSTKGLQLDGVKNIVAIAFGKGGVGKSTTTGDLGSFDYYFVISKH